MILLIVITALVLSVDTVASGRCPASQDIKPCTCTEQQVKCSSAHELELSDVFKAIAAGGTDIHFDTFELHGTKTTKLTDSMFHGIKFKTLRFISCDQLVCVSPTAFRGLENSVEKFIAEGTSFRWDLNHADECNIFNALNSLQSLRELNITSSKINEIPAGAFHDLTGSQSKLVTIDLSEGIGGEITKIGKRAFSSLKALKYLDLSSHKINSIDSYAFEFISPSSDKLTINLEGNNITYKSFGNESLNVIGKATTLKLGANPLLQVLEESVFHSFLSNAGQNHIDLKGSPLACHTKNVWLLENKIDFKLQQKISNATSPDGLDFWDHTKSQCNSNKDSIKTTI